MSPLKAGTKEIVISPDFPAYLHGFPAPQDRYSRSVHDDLYAHCFYLESNDEKFAIITLDLLLLPKFVVKRLRTKINELAGIPESHILVSTTHTHSAPVAGAVPFYLDKPCDLMYPHYIDNIVNRVSHAVLWAKENSFEAKIGIGKGYCGPEQNVGGNRHDKNGPSDTGVFVIGIKDMADTLRGVIVRYSLHPTFLNQNNRLVSSDYPGYLYQYLKNQFKGVVPAFQIGTAGNQSPRFFRSGCTFEEAERVGTTIAKEAVTVLETMSFVSEPDIHVCSKEVAPVRKTIPPLDVATENLKIAEQNFQNAIDNRLDIGVVRTLECAVFGARRMFNWATLGADTVYAINEEHPFEVFVMTIGDFAIVGLPGELFVEFGLELQKASPYKNTVVVCCANGFAKGYICTSEAIAQGGYEANGSPYTGETGTNLVQAALELLNASLGK